MLRTTRATTICLALLLASAMPAQASIVWDFSPAAHPTAAQGGVFGNQATAQNFAEKISFINAVTLTGMDIYTRNTFASVGQSTTIRLRNDSSGAPGTLALQFVDDVEIEDTDGALGADIVRAYVEFTAPIVLAANTTYWIGMSGTSSELGQLGLTGSNAPDDSFMYKYNGLVLSPPHTASDMAFRLHGDFITAVPEPTSLALLSVAGLGGMGLRWMRRRNGAARS